MWNNAYIKAKKIIDRAGEVLVISHRKPDADTLGAAISLRILLGRMGKEVTMACVDRPSRVFDFLPHVDEFVNEFELDNFDLVIIVDAGASYMTNFHITYPDLFEGNVPIINIDHHASNDNFGDLNIIDTDAASATLIIYKMISCWGESFDEDMATVLLAGIYGDTGSFMHSNTSGEVYEIAGDLMSKGARVAEISRALFGPNSVSTLKLWGKVLSNAQMTSDNVVMSIVRDRDFKGLDAGAEQLSGVVDYLNMVPNSKFAVLINEDQNGNVKGSFRTRKEEVDLSRIASVFGGGGHPKASGFSVPGRLKKEVRYTIVSEDLSKKSLDF